VNVRRISTLLFADVNKRTSILSFIVVYLVSSTWKDFCARRTLKSKQEANRQIHYLMLVTIRRLYLNEFVINRLRDSHRKIPTVFYESCSTSVNDLFLSIFFVYLGKKYFSTTRINNSSRTSKNNNQNVQLNMLSHSTLTRDREWDEKSYDVCFLCLVHRSRQQSLIWPFFRWYSCVPDDISYSWSLRDSTCS
jgi:hypothetical protein